MGAEDNEPKGGQGDGGDGSQNPADDPKPAGDPKPSDDPKPGADGDGKSGEPKDKHGHPGINAEKYKRDIEAKDAEIAKLQAKVEEAAKTEEGRKQLQSEIEKLKAEQADERVNHKLEMAGCKNTKAARALLEDYDGDVEKLKSECPYLFDDEKHKQSGSTGGKPGGAASEKVDDLLDKAMKIKKG